MAGQTDYMGISSGQGPCFYPAGHLWHYSPIYFLYMYTEKAELIHKFLHILLHSGNISIVVSLAYKYFHNDIAKAQIISFMLISNNGMRQLNQMMFNDSIMSFYVLLCMFFVSKNRPISGAFSLTLGLSIKTGAILLFPGFLGWV